MSSFTRIIKQSPTPIQKEEDAKGKEGLKVETKVQLSTDFAAAVFGQLHTIGDKHGGAS